MDARDRSPVSRPTLHRRLSSAEQYRLLCADIAARLRPVCPTFSEAEFETLVQDIAAVKLRHPDDEELSTVFDRARQ